MTKIKFFLLLYPVFIAFTTFLFMAVDQDAGLLPGVGIGVVMYPILWYGYLIMNIQDKDNGNADDQGEFGKREIDNCR